MRLLLATALASAGLLAAGCASTQEAPSEPALAGCYQFVWTDATSDLGLPWGFELLASELTGWGDVPGARDARTRVTATETSGQPFAFWREVGDSVSVGHPGGGGFALMLSSVEGGRALIGTARPVGDAVAFGEEFGPREAREVTARRVACPPAG